MLWLAHDGSLNADWLSHYAVRFAERLPARKITALTVKDGSETQARAPRRLEFLAAQCDRAHLHLSVEELALDKDVVHTLLARIPEGSDQYLLCGTRVRRQSRGFLAGTVSEQLLAAQRFNVLALRVVQPGLLGQTHRVLIPVMGHPRGFASGLPFVKLMGADLQSVHVLIVKSEFGWSAARRGGAVALDLNAASAYVSQIQAELRLALSHDFGVDGSVVDGHNAADEIVLGAKQHQCQLIYLGASERSLALRMLAGTPIERILAHAPCDVAIYRGVR